MFVRFFVVFTLLFFAGCLFGPKKYKHQFFAMDTLVEVTLFAPSKQQADAIIDSIKVECRRFENRYSPFKPGSVVLAINNRADRLRVVVDSETAELVKEALAYCRETKGIFDITIGPIKWLWGLGSDQTPRKPRQGEIDSTRIHIGWERVRVSGDTLFFSDPETMIDLGGYAKGVSLKRMADIVRRNGIPSFLINAGGDLIAGSPKPDGSLWTIGVQDPRRPDTAIALEKVANGCVITSGDYERYFIEDGVRYHHLFDPRTGYPSRGIISSTVQCDNPVRGVVYSKVLMIAGAEWGFKRPDSIQCMLLVDTAMKKIER